MSVPDFSFSEAVVKAGKVAYDESGAVDHISGFINRAFALFLGSDVGFEDKDGLEWEGVRSLGEGGFGLVGLWVAKDKHGTNVKEIAVKQCGREEGIRIPQEALIMKQLNALKCPNIVRLENFKIYPNEEMERYYLELCPYGDLQELWRKYRAKRRFMPEEFLWHMFHGLARAARVMARGPFRNLETDEPTSHRLLHLDIKPQNIMLGYKKANSVFRSYPVVKLADFGVSELSGPDDPRNPRGFDDQGTTAYMPPEQRQGTLRDELNGHAPKEAQNRRFGGWRNPPLSENARLESRTNIWSIGLVMYLLMTLRTVNQFMDQTEYIWEEDFIRFGQHVMGPIQSRCRPEYSRRLRDLVRDCLNHRIASRPSASSLLARTAAGLEAYRTRSDTGEDTTEEPDIGDMISSNSALRGEAAQRIIRADARGVQSTGSRFDLPKPKRSSWEPLRVKRPHSAGDAEAPIIINSRSTGILPAEPPSDILNERAGKKRRRDTADGGFASRAKDTITRRIPGEVITILDDEDEARRGKETIRSLPTEVVSVSDEGLDPRNPDTIRDTADKVITISYESSLASRDNGTTRSIADEIITISDESSLASIDYLTNHILAGEVITISDDSVSDRGPPYYAVDAAEESKDDGSFQSEHWGTKDAESASVVSDPNGSQEGSLDEDSGSRQLLFF